MVQLTVQYGMEKSKVVLEVNHYYFKCLNTLQLRKQTQKNPGFSKVRN
jgi:hypothetical protein